MRVLSNHLIKKETPVQSTGALVASKLTDPDLLVRGCRMETEASLDPEPGSSAINQNGQIVASLASYIKKKI